MKCLIVGEYLGISIGECWLQEMNIEYLIEKFPHHILKRIDIMIGEKEYWNKGIGTRIIKKTS